MFVDILLDFRFDGSGEHLLGTLEQNVVKAAAANEACIASHGVGLFG